MVQALRIALIADAYPPMRTSGAVQLRDLSQEMLRQGHQPLVIIPSSQISEPWVLEEIQGVQVLRVKAFPTKDIGYVMRTMNEFMLPFLMLRHFRKSPFAKIKWDGVVWYSPTIFLGPIVKALKKASHCRSYLIIRDIFPEWAVDMGLLRKGLPYYFFKLIERYQYSVADVIGVQTPGNLAYFDKTKLKPGQRVEVLQNWLAEPVKVTSSITISETPLAGRKIFVYAGNMGVAQGMMILIDLVGRLHHREDIGFLFVGRGSDALKLRDLCHAKSFSNVLFFDEIDPFEIPALYAQCHVGLVALDHRHKTHNIPGKFLTYMQSGLPVLANVNLGNDLAEIIRNENVGEVCESSQLEDLLDSALSLLNYLEADKTLSLRCKNLYLREFTSEHALRRIVNALSN
jgi:glycosyltransferase involved in cell wall biosynthesis